MRKPTDPTGSTYFQFQGRGEVSTSPQRRVERSSWTELRKLGVEGQPTPRRRAAWAPYAARRREFRAAVVQDPSVH